MEGLQALLSWLQRRREAGFYESLVDRRRLAIAAGLAGTAIYSLRQRRELVRTVPLSALLKHAERGLIEGALIGPAACTFRVRDAATAASQVCRATLLPADGKLFLMQILHRNGVEFSVQGAAGWRGALVLLLPFAYLGLCGWLLHRMSNEIGINGGGGDAPAVGSDLAGGAFFFNSPTHPLSPPPLIALPIWPHWSYSHSLFFCILSLSHTLSRTP